MNQSHDAEKRRGWVATTHPLVARGYHYRLEHLNETSYKV